MIINKSEKLKLLTFAHRGEAQTFIRELKLKAVPFAFDGLYRNSDLLLLLTGEGPQRATERTSAVLGAYYDEIEQVINLGVCATLSSHININQIVSIRTIYREADQKMEFKSFTTQDDQACTDIITSHQRVLDIKYAGFLQSFAPLVDRELWAIASSAQNFHIPCYSYKLISDNALIENKEICQVVKDMAEEFSDKLFKHFNSVYQQEEKEIDEFSIFSNKSFYFTVSQKRKYITIMKGLIIRKESEDDILKKINIKDIEKIDTLPKQRAAIVIEKIFSILNPFNTRLEKKISKLTSPLIEANCQIKFTKDYEDNNFNIIARIEHPNNISKLKRSLDNFEYQKLIDVLSGEDDV